MSASGAVSIRVVRQASKAAGNDYQKARGGSYSEALQRAADSAFAVLSDHLNETDARWLAQKLARAA